MEGCQCITIQFLQDLLAVAKEFTFAFDLMTHDMNVVVFIDESCLQRSSPTWGAELASYCHVV